MVSDKDLLASATLSSAGDYIWKDGSHVLKWCGTKWRVTNPASQWSPIEIDANGEYVCYPSAEAAARALFDAGYGPAKCQKPSLAKAILQDGMSRIDEAYRESSPPKQKLPPELRLYHTVKLAPEPSPEMELFIAWCEAHYDCSPPIPPKPPALEPFLIEKNGERKWAYIAYRNGDFGTPEGDYAADNGWKRWEEKP